MIERLVKKIGAVFFLVAVIASAVNTAYCAEPFFSDGASQTTDSVNLSIEISYNPNPSFLAVEQTDFIRTQANGFGFKTPADPGRYRHIGTTYLTWQSRGVYEIIIYTDNINSLGLQFFLPPEGESPELKSNVVNMFGGLYPPQSIWPAGMPSFVPFKVWVPKTAGLVNIGTDLSPNYVAQTTAPVNPDGSVDAEYYNGGTAQNPEPSFGYIPEKLAVDLSVGTYGSYKKVIASTFDKTWPPRIEMTFAIDLANSSITNNYNAYGIGQYEGVVIIDLVGN